MKINKKKHIAMLLIFLFQLLMSCNFNKTMTYVNDNIDIKIKSKIDSLNNIVFNSIRSNTTLPINNLLDTKLKNMGNSKVNIRQMVNYLNSNYKDIPLKKYNEFYIISEGKGERNASLYAFDNDNIFISLKVWSPEIYISLYETNTLKNDLLISLVYEKENEYWKIRNFNIGERRNFGKTFQQWMTEIKEDTKNLKMYSAFIKLLYAQTMLKPAPFMNYVLDDSTKEMINNLTKNTFPSESFPIEFSDIKSKPEILSIRPKPITDVQGIFPRFIYKTQYSLDSVNLLQNEVNMMSREIIRRYPGIDKQFTSILFSATNEGYENNQKRVEYYNLVYKFN